MSAPRVTHSALRPPLLTNSSSRKETSEPAGTPGLQFNYGGRKYTLRVPNRDNEEGVYEDESLKLQKEATIKQLAIRVLQNAERAKIFSADNPIQSINKHGITTADKKVHENIDGWRELKEVLFPKHETRHLSQEHSRHSAAASAASASIAPPSTTSPIIAPILDIRGPELILLRQNPLLNPLLLQESSSQDIESIYKKLPIAARLRILRTLLLDPTVQDRGIYKWVRESLRIGQDLTTDVIKAIAQEIKCLSKQMSPGKIEGLHIDLINEIYTEFMQKAPGTLPEEITDKIRWLMNRRMAHKETLVQHYRATCEAKGITPPAFTSTPEAFCNYWCYYKHAVTPESLNEITTFVEAIASWADTDDENLDTKNLAPQEEMPLSLSYIPARILGRTKGWDDRWIVDPLCSLANKTWGSISSTDPRYTLYLALFAGPFLAGLGIGTSATAPTSLPSHLSNNTMPLSGAAHVTQTLLDVGIVTAATSTVWVAHHIVHKAETIYDAIISAESRATQWTDHAASAVRHSLPGQYARDVAGGFAWSLGTAFDLVKRSGRAIKAGYQEFKKPDPIPVGRK